MPYRFFQFLFLFGIFIHPFFATDELWCYSCKGIECEQLKNNDRRRITCNEKTQLCWTSWIDQQPYRTCASRYCTPNDFSLDSEIHIQTCCRSNLCNSASLSLVKKGKLYRQISASDHTKITTIGYFITHIINRRSEEGKSLSRVSSNPSASLNSDRLLYDKDFSNRIASISRILLFLMPILLF